MNEEAYKSLFAELAKYEESGIFIKLGNYPASPMQVVNAHIIREESNYMRDYEWDEAGHVQKLSFHEIKSKDKQDTPRA